MAGDILGVISGVVGAVATNGVIGSIAPVIDQRFSE